LTPGERPTAGFGGYDNFSAFYHRDAAKKNVKLPIDGAADPFRVKATAAEKAGKAIRGCVYGEIFRSGKTVQTAGEGPGGGWRHPYISARERELQGIAPQLSF
jgi:hypothetical protein